MRKTTEGDDEQVQLSAELEILPVRLLNLLVEEINNETVAAEEAMRRVHDRAEPDSSDSAITDALTAFDHAAIDGHIPSDDAYVAGELIGRFILWIEQFKVIWGLDEKDLRRLAMEALELYAGRSGGPRLCI